MKTQISGEGEQGEALLPCPLDCIRCEALAVAGFSKEATVVSAVRVAIDELGRAYEAFDIHDFERGARLDFAILKLIGKAPSAVDGNAAVENTGTSSLNSPPSSTVAGAQEKKTPCEALEKSEASADNVDAVLQKIRDLELVSKWRGVRDKLYMRMNHKEDVRLMEEAIRELEPFLSDEH